MEKKAQVILPEKYYHAYFVELLEFVEKYSGHLLFESHQEFINRFKRLSEDAQCLFIRMSNRRGQFFRPSAFQYPEINSLPAAIDQLITSGFCAEPYEGHATQLHLYKKSELLAVFEVPESLKKTTKDILISFLETLDYLPCLMAHDPMVQLCKEEEVAYIKMLYFGDIHTEMTEFVIRDVGHIKLQLLDHQHFKPWFSSREEAKATFEISHIYQSVKALIGDYPGEEIVELLSPLSWETFAQWKSSAQIADKLLLRLAQQLEREKQPVLALDLYLKTRKPPARERAVRLYTMLDEEEKAIAVAQEMLVSPGSVTEKIFAKDFLQKSRKRINRSTTERIKYAPVLELPFDDCVRVEQLVLRHFKANGYSGAHVENSLWRNMFGLVFWEVLYDQQSGAYHHPLQRMADDLYDQAFFQNRQNDLQHSLKAITSKAGLKKRIRQNWQKYEGTTTPLVSWEVSALDLMMQVAEKIPVDKIRQTLLVMAENMRDNSTGFPDLFVWNASTYHFYEIKSPNDQLSAQQLFWLDFFEENGIHAEVLRVKYVE